jgi:hypothetical protein
MPDSFEPENVLVADGKFVRKEAYMPFAAGTYTLTLLLD